MKFYQPVVFTCFIMFIFFIIDIIKNHHFDAVLFSWSIGLPIGIYLWIDDYRKKKFLKEAIDWL